MPLTWEIQHHIQRRRRGRLSGGEPLLRSSGGHFGRHLSGGGDWQVTRGHGDALNITDASPGVRIWSSLSLSATVVHTGNGEEKFIWSLGDQSPLSGRLLRLQIPNQSDCEPVDAEVDYPDVQEEEFEKRETIEAEGVNYYMYFNEKPSIDP